ncbi:MAG TPA: VOC family protein [Solirubrobacteraceae bacterium]|nr:VOC family protein [Solirubrobacteraceae bacterium]
MKLEGIHHITAITGDAPGNVEFYVGVLGLRMVKKTVNQDDPTVYHLFYADEHGSPGSDLTFFEYPGAAAGAAGAGMVHRIVWRVGSDATLDFWERRLRDHDVATERAGGGLRFADPEGLEHELIVSTVDDAPLAGGAPDVPREHALQGFDGVRAYTHDPAESERLLRETLGFTGGDDGAWEVRGDERGGVYAYDSAPDVRPRQGAGTVHHVAFASRMEDHEAWQERVARGGARPTPVIDRFYFRSIYFREPSGVLFEIATLGPGFDADEDAQHLGERLSLPPKFERLRPQLEQTLTPLPDPRAARTGAA